MFVAVICIGNWQKSVTSWYPVIWFTEMHAAWPVVTHMSYNDMKSRIDGLLLLEPTCVADANKGAMLRAGRL